MMAVVVPGGGCPYCGGAAKGNHHYRGHAGCYQVGHAVGRSLVGVFVGLTVGTPG
jgi:hypothetical protein